DFAVAHDTSAMRMDVFNRVFDRNDVTAAILIAIADHRRERRGFTRARTADDEAQTALRHRNIFELIRQLEILEARNLRDDRTNDGADVSLSDERAHAKTADALRR